MNEPLDSDTRALVMTVLDRARRLGLDPAEALHKAGLILTPAKDKRTRLQAMSYLILQVSEWRPAEFLRRKQNTPADIYQSILDFMQEHVVWWEKNQ